MKQTAELMQARKLANEMRGSDYPFAPHLSLVYGDWAEDVRLRALQELGGSDALLGQPMRMTRVLLMDCNAKDHSSWQLLHEAFLK